MTKLPVPETKQPALRQTTVTDMVDKCRNPGSQVYEKYTIYSCRMVNSYCLK